MPESPEQLKNKIADLEKEIKRYKFENDLLQAEILQLKRHRFGSKSERCTENGFTQLSLFDDLDAEPIEAPNDDDDNESNVVDIAAHKRKVTNKKKFSDSLPRREVIIPVPESERVCGCGCQKVTIRYEETERLNVIPATYEVVVEKREVVGCKKRCKGSMLTAPKEPTILPKMRVKESVLADIIVSKLVDRQPCYHLEKKYETRCGFKLSRQSMADYMIKSSGPLQPLVNLIKDHVIDYDIGALDATTFQVLNEPGRKAKTKSYIYCFRGGPPDKKSVLFEYNPILHKKFTHDWFDGFQGKLHCDADPWFEELFEVEGITASNCLAHGRRKFEPIAKATEGDGLAKQAMQFFKAIYRIEKFAKKEEMTPDQRFLLRLERTQPILDKFKAWLDQNYPTVLLKSKLGIAMGYMIKHWKGLCIFMTDGRLEVDNNLTEQEMKAFAVIRKNILFSQSVDGVKALCIHFTLLRTAIHHNLNPFEYYHHVLKMIPNCKRIEDFEALLPWNFAAVDHGISAAA